MPIGKGRRPAPPGYITAARAGELLGQSRMYKLAKAGRLQRHTPPGQKHGYYLESEVQSILDADKAFFEEKLHKLPARFAHARPGDMQSLYELANRLFGSITIPPERRREWIEKEPRGHYVMKAEDTNRVVAYLYLLALSHDRILQYMKECRAGNITGEEVQRLTSGTPHEMVIAGIGRDPRADKQYTAALLHGFVQDLERWGSQGIEISRFCAFSETLDGVYLCLSMGMKQWGKPRFRDGSPCFKFVLEVQESDIPLLRPYKRALAEYRQSHQEAQETPVPPQPDTRRPATPQRTPAPRIPRQESREHTAQPPDTITLQEFAEQLGIARRTLLEQIVKYGLPHVAIPDPARQNEMKRYFTVEQQEAVKEFRKVRRH